MKFVVAIGYAIVIIIDIVVVIVNIIATLVLTVNKKSVTGWTSKRRRFSFHCLFRKY